MEIRGVDGQAVSGRLVDWQGRLVHERPIEQAAGTESVNVPLSQSWGTMLLKINTGSQ